MKQFDKIEVMMNNFATKGAFLTVKDRNGNINTMTVAWGFIGYMWNKPHFICYVRPQRYTKGLIDNAKDFTISVPVDALKVELKECGVKSGRDVDKSKIVNFIPAKVTDSPVVSGCEYYYECVIHYEDSLKEKFADDFIKNFYKDDYHYFYMGEIVENY